MVNIEAANLNTIFKQRKFDFVATLFTFGLFNNAGYSMIAAGASTLAKDFDKASLMPLF